MKRTILRIILLLSFIAADLRAQYPASNFSLIALTDPETTLGSSDSIKYSGCWGWYQEDKKKEYAIACSHKGTYWIDITVPSTPTVSAYRAGELSGCIWREAKSYKNFLYVISDDQGSNSFQIFDMQYLPDSVHKVYDGTTLFSQGHTLWIDGDHLYVASVSTANTYSSMCVYSLANPTSPVKLRALDDDFPFINSVHDMYVRHDTVYASCAWQGLYVFKFTGTVFSFLGSLTNYPASGYNHSSALTPDGKTLVFADEVPAGLPIKVSDVTNLSNIQVLASTNQFAQTTPHNPFIPNDQLCFLSSYQDGLQLYDISDPSSPQLAGYFDTYPQAGGNVNSYPSGDTYFGQWGCYPFFPSGNIFALDRQNGGFILRTPFYGGPQINMSVDLPPSACLNSSLVSTALSTGASSVSWSGPGLSITPVTGHSTTISFSAAGVYSLLVTASNSGSTTTVVRTITVTTMTAATTATNPSCANCTNGVVKVTPSGGTPPFTYTWSPASGSGSLSSHLGAGCYTISISDAGGCKDTVSACLQAPSDVGIAEIQKKKIRIYPNPAHDKLFVEIPGDVDRFTVSNLLGENVLQGAATPGIQILDVSSLPKGVYVLILLSEKGRAVVNFVMQ